ncbi:polyprenyl synthetase family protein [Streptococcus saliviloxodontae]|uniref:Heptaprenyl diphosphate synthase n=1 Tax=Streptococcus saliviloxodontae TaxID=1349416 RepID=A0ABS2PLI4_9STRE|nr:polyprenyl synthetase family protein [Streptococcus saliviloxodontae]MBM7635653.1 heptaprenyl diphosphate synthase [Streptococcus saliviloxodontae]
MPSFWSKYSNMESKINAVQDIIKNEFTIRNTDIQEAMQSLTSSGGKQLRPAFFLLFSQFGDKNKAKPEETQLKIAASLEVLHMATLIHDDVIDDSPLRRGQVTIQSQYGKDIAVYTGDLLFTIFFKLMLETMSDTPYMAINAKIMRNILLGELDQMSLRFNQTQHIRQYLHAISGKTAALFKLASQEGAYFGGASTEIIHRSARIGHSIGMAFQILDDILDYTADPKTFNKPILEDLATGVYSLPLLLALQKNPDSFKPLLDKERNISESECRQVAQLVIDNQGVSEAREIAKCYTQKAINDIKKLPNNPSKKLLLKLTNELLKRHI